MREEFGFLQVILLENDEPPDADAVTDAVADVEEPPAEENETMVTKIARAPSY